MTYTSFSKETFAAFKADDRAGPVQLLNLIRLREIAAYPDGRAASGAEAYEAYSRISEPIFKRLGGVIAWRGGFEMMLVGPESESWDICFVAQYPSVDGFVALMRDPTYREAMRHRQAAVADSRLVRFASQRPGTAFGAGGDVA